MIQSNCSKFFKCNPFDDLDNEIKFNFQKCYGLCLNKLNYNVFGIVDDCFLLSLIGESNLFHVYLGYKYGRFFSVKIMKRNKYEQKETSMSNLSKFEKEVELRMKLQQQEFIEKQYESQMYSENNFNLDLNFDSIYKVNKSLQIKMHFADYGKCIIYEDYCVNGRLSYYAYSTITEKLIRTIFLSLLDYLRKINESSRLYYTDITLDDLIFDERFNLKLLGIRKLKHSVFSSNIFYENFSVMNQEQVSQVSCLIIILCQMLFKEDYERILPFLKNDLKLNDISSFFETEKLLMKGLDAQLELTNEYSCLGNLLYSESNVKNFKKEDEIKSSNLEYNNNSPNSISFLNFEYDYENNIEKEKEILMIKTGLNEDDSNLNNFSSPFINTEKNKEIEELNLKKLETHFNYDKSQEKKEKEIYIKNLTLLELILNELISKYSEICKIKDKDSTREFIKRLIRDKSIEDLEFLSWFNGEIMDTIEYEQELSKFRNKSLSKSFSDIADKEKSLIMKKNGIFKVVKFN